MLRSQPFERILTSATRFTSFSLFPSSFPLFSFSLRIRSGFEENYFDSGFLKNIVNKVRIIVIIVIVYFVESRIFLFCFFVRSGIVICLVVRIVRVFSFSSLRGIEVSPLGFHIIRIFLLSFSFSPGINYSKSFYYFPPFNLWKLGNRALGFAIIKISSFPFLSFLPRYLTLYVTGISAIIIYQTVSFVVTLYSRLFFFSFSIQSTRFVKSLEIFLANNFFLSLPCKKIFGPILYKLSPERKELERKIMGRG